MSATSEPDPPSEFGTRYGGSQRLLTSIAYLVEREIAEPLVTISSGGLLVSGRLISGRRYLSALAEEAQDQEPIAARLASVLLEDFPADDAVEEHLTPSQLDWLNMRDARAIQPGGLLFPANRPVLWRVRIGAVDSYFFGALAADEPEESIPLFDERF